MRIKRRRLRNYALPEIILTPLIDTFATLLVMFIITAPIAQNSIKVDLPYGKNKEVGINQELIVTLSKDGKLFFNNFPVEKNMLVKTVQKAISAKQDMPIFVRADKSVSYGKVIGIVDQLKEAGVKYVAMSTQQITP